MTNEFGGSALVIGYWSFAVAFAVPCVRRFPLRLGVLAFSQAAGKAASEGLFPLNSWYFSWLMS
jgi:hypothetical protein